MYQTLENQDQFTDEELQRFQQEWEERQRQMNLRQGQGHVSAHAPRRTH